MEEGAPTRLSSSGAVDRQRSGMRERGTRVMAQESLRDQRARTKVIWHRNREGLN